MMTAPTTASSTARRDSCPRFQGMQQGVHEFGDTPTHTTLCCVCRCPGACENTRQRIPARATTSAHVRIRLLNRTTPQRAHSRQQEKVLQVKAPSSGTEEPDARTYVYMVGVGSRCLLLSMRSKGNCPLITLQQQACNHV